MKKMNNKGFAISTVIYGLSIMGILIITILMGTMSSTRKNTKLLSKTIEEELNNLSKTSFTFNAKKKFQSYTVPEGQSGYYKIELWGAQGGDNGGLGSYTSGIINLKENQVLRFVIGKKGDINTGGEATNVRSSALYTDIIMLAAGGGAKTDADGGTLYGYTSNMKSHGGKINIEENNNFDGDYNLIPNSNLVGFSADYIKSPLAYEKTTETIVGKNGGGGGYNKSTDSSTGGTSYISGYAGQHLHNSGLYFIDGQMIPGVNYGDGKARIEKIADTLDRKNNKLDRVKIIKDCLSTSNSSNISWKKFSAKYQGNDVPFTETAPSTKEGFICKEYTLSNVTDLDEIAVWHQDGIDYKNHTIKIGHPTGVWSTLKDLGNETEFSETETVTGIRISAYQPDYTKDIPDSGSYYIIPVLSENKCLTISETQNNYSVLADFISGSKRQIWSINKLDEKLKDDSNTSIREFTIAESNSHKVLSINEQQNMIGNNIIATSFNQITRDETSIWKIEPVGNGTYIISTSEHSVSKTNPYFGTNIVYDSKNNKFIIGKNNINTTRVKLIALNY